MLPPPLLFLMPYVSEPDLLLLFLDFCDVVSDLEIYDSLVFLFLPLES